jgi:hypothetical protein
VRRHVRTLAWAGGLTALSIYGGYAIDHIREPLWLAEIAVAPALPGFVVLLLCCGGGGFGSSFLVALRIATFAFWAIVIHLIQWFHYSGSARRSHPLTFDNHPNSPEDHRG